MTKRKLKKEIVSIIEVIVIGCILLVVMTIFVTHNSMKHKQELMDKNFFQSKVLDQQPLINDQKQFWKDYDNILKARADSNGNGIVSLQEKEAFDEQFFEERELTVDPVTKVVTKKSGIPANGQALICHLNSFYMDQPWVMPVCPDL
jgi:hypothetical protein